MPHHRHRVSAASIAALACAALSAPALAAPPQLPPAQPGTLAGSCEDLPARLGGLANTVITGSTTVPAGTLSQGGQPIAEHCRVTGRMNERVSPVDGKTYAIGFEVRLPKAWNGRFYHQGNGGIDGNVVTALGALGGGPLTGALMQGFAVLSSDAGHTLAQGGPAFGLDPQARLDYGYQAVGALTPMAKQLIAAAYERGPDRSYFGGCSNGGRHTLVAAARYAQDYDGFLAGAPGYRLPLAALANIWGAQRYATVATGDPLTAAGLETAYTATERRLVADAVLARCDALDGAVDGLVQDTQACQRAFKLRRDVPTCTGARDGTCLSEAQKAVVDGVFKGAITSTGSRFYNSFPYDGGVAGSGIAVWEFSAPLDRDSGAVGVIFKVPPSTDALTNGPAFSLGLNIDKALGELYATDSTYTESSMSFMTPGDSDFGEVYRRGGKILVYHGVSDPIFSVDDTEDWYRGLLHGSKGKRTDFARLYRIPGMGHCSGGPATDQADFLSPLVAWVEQGQAPQAIVAQARGAGNPGGVNADVPVQWAADRTRPLCPFPQVARYNGSGDVERAANWSCQPKSAPSERVARR
ncbi:MAG: tannase/feruloyl esterase family alpha/beta hydrolase [Burkholderiales bacterium]|nr:tannase/feruloyl esterase family alpha/beta hydrolase [Burkholderiales bacterium]